jgi:D-glutamate cyclase
MDAADRAIAEIEGLSARDIQRRNIGPLAAFTRGNLARAAASIARHPSPSIAIITGFYLGHGEPPNCETDGPPGAAMLAAGFAAAGIPCRIATDLVNARVVRATAAAADPESRIPIDIVSMRRDGSDGATPLGQVEEIWRRQHPPITHVISIERCGPSRDGCPRDARGVDMTDCNAPLEILFDAGPWTTIGIGDLGNEIGMGSLPFELVADSVPRGAQLWCRVACDHPIVGGVSNWAGAALLGACALLWPRGAGGMLESLRPEFGRRLLEAAVWEGGAVASDRSGAIPRTHMFVDGQPWTVLEQIHRQIYDLCRGVLLAGESQATGP